MRKRGSGKKQPKGKIEEKKKGQDIIRLESGAVIVPLRGEKWLRCKLAKECIDTVINRDELGGGFSCERCPHAGEEVNFEKLFTAVTGDVEYKCHANFKD